MAYKDLATKKAYSVKYRQEHLEEKRVYDAKYREEHREEKKTYDAKYREDLMAYSAKYREEHREEVRARIRAWQKANPLKVRQRDSERRARKKNATIGPVDFAAIMIRDKMICGLCHKKVKLTLLQFDHIVPLSKGGAHSEDNLQVAHAVCNMRKNNTGWLPSQIRLSFMV